MGLEQKAPHAAIWASRQRGYGFSNSLLTAGIGGIGQCIFSPSGSPIAGVGIASVTSRIVSERLDELLRLLRQEIEVISREPLYHSRMQS